ncbi:hypothetical protein PR202_gb21570 [Eleusine coracana subsp. coracana]|uniref:RING-type E3 ubiquitin transferase n=1 Tax=Eleusine coracana subsp. coracana TaxID=191504 RepID=A0AAV5FBG2_ELECO|nr:hypothetical protein PR202_gb21570 [Eleusine coracana subsp. coracana]
MAIAETTAIRKLLHGARGVAAFSFSLDGLRQLTSGFFTDILAGLAHLLVLPLEALWRLLVAAVSGVAGFLPRVLAALWHLLVAAAGAIGSGLVGLWRLAAGFIPRLFAALWHILVAAAGATGSGLGGLWRLVAGLFPHLFSALAGLWHLAAGFVPRILAALWHLLVAAAGAIGSGLGGLCRLVASLLHLLLVVPLETVWQWAQPAAAAALRYALAAAAALVLVALVRRFGPAVCAAAVGACRAVARAARYLVLGLRFVGARVSCYLARGLSFVGARAASFLLRHCGRHRQQDDDEDVEDADVGTGDDVCAVCLAELHDGAGETLRRRLHPCGHAFHRDCVDRWLRDHDTCPLCRAPVQAHATGDDVCAVCLAELRDGAGETRRLLHPCGHAFHQGCIDPWLRYHGTCPLCRAPVQAPGEDARTEEAEGHVINQSAR